MSKTFSNVEKPWLFQSGGKPGPGRPKGGRNKLSEAFLADLHDDWMQRGGEVIQAVRSQDPSTYIRVVASILPKEVKLTRPLDDMSDAELANAIELVRAALADSKGQVQ